LSKQKSGEELMDELNTVVLLDGHQWYKPKLLAYPESINKVVVTQVLHAHHMLGSNLGLQHGILFIHDKLLLSAAKEGRTSSPWQGIVQPEPHVTELLFGQSLECGQPFILLPFGSFLPFFTSSEFLTLPANGVLHHVVPLRIISQTSFTGTTCPWLPVRVGDACKIHT
jgi:hypothetical protein